DRKVLHARYTLERLVHDDRGRLERAFDHDLATTCAHRELRETEALQPHPEIGKLVVDLDFGVFGVDRIDLALKRGVIRTAGLDRDLLDLDRVEIVVREDASLMDANRLVCRRGRGTERQIEVLESKSIVDIADRRELAAEVLAGRRRELGR